MNFIEVLILFFIVIALTVFSGVFDDSTDDIVKAAISNDIHTVEIKGSRYYVSGEVSYIYGKRGILRSYDTECIGGVAYYKWEALTTLVDPNGLPMLCNMPEGFIIGEEM